MKTVLTSNSNRDAFESVLFANDLIVVQKDWNDHLSHTQVVYVYNELGDELPKSAIFREITEDGTDYWKEEYSYE